MGRNISIKFYLIAYLAIFSIFILSSCDDKEHTDRNTTIKDQLLNEMKNKNIEVDKILHLEVVKDGILVFYTRDNNLYDGFFKLKESKFVWYRGGGGLPIQTDFDLSSGGTNFREFYVRYGLITDNKIMRVKDEENKKYAKIVQIENGLRIYFILHKSVESAGFEKMVPVYKKEN